jgi:uncharacterized phage-associated protein
MTTAQDVSDYFVALAHERGQGVNNLKMQKLLYYAQAWHLALLGEPLFPEKFQAWTSGPVIPELYWRYKEFGIDPIARSRAAPQLDGPTTEFLDEVAAVYMPFNEWQLHWKARAEAPWRRARGGMDDGELCENELSEEDMGAYFRSIAVAA